MLRLGGEFKYAIHQNLVKELVVIFVVDCFGIHHIIYNILLGHKSVMNYIINE